MGKFILRFPLYLTNTHKDMFVLLTIIAVKFCFYPFVSTHKASSSKEHGGSQRGSHCPLTALYPFPQDCLVVEDGRKEKSWNRRQAVLLRDLRRIKRISLKCEMDKN